MLDHLFNNPFFSGGISVALVGALLALCRNIPAEIWRRIRVQAIVEVEILGTDPVFEWLKVWMARHDYTRRSRLLNASADPTSRSGDAAAVVFTPAPGSHFLRYRGRLVWIVRAREGIESANIIWRESFTIRVLSRDPEVARALLADARAAFLSRADGRISVMRAQWSSWSEADRLLPRSPDSVVLGDPVVMDWLGADMQRFFGAEAWYRDHGIPYRRGYLFEGVPGSGKSSAIVALAGYVGRNIYLLSLSGRSMDDQRLQDLMMQIPDTGIVVLEDIDAAMPARQADEDEPQCLTLSGLLNAIDGIGAREGRLLFMTTNHAERLDAALIRAGRIDVRVHFGHATRDQARRLYARFHPGSTALEVERFAARVDSEQTTMADLQGMLIAGVEGDQRSPQAAVA